MNLLQRNRHLCQIGSELTVWPHTVEHFIQRPDHWNGPYNVVFADPPYAETARLSSLLTESMAQSLFATDAWLIVEHGQKNGAPTALGPTTLRRQYRYGDTTLSLYCCPDLHHT